MLRLGKKAYKKTLDIKVDEAIAKELDEIERAIAIETGQWRTNPNWPSQVEHYEHAIPLAQLFSPTELDRARARAEALAALEAETPPSAEGTAEERSKPQ